MKSNKDIRAVFDHWNKGKGLKVPKKSNKTCWWSCRLDSEGKIPFDTNRAIKAALSHYSLSDVTQAISNYALVLLGKEYKWSHVWCINVFFTVRYEKRMESNKKWWQFLPHNFDEESFLEDWARTRRKTQQRKRPTTNFFNPKSVPQPKPRGAAQQVDLDKLEK